MVDIQPFAGYRPRPDVVSRVACPPYDVLSTEEAREQAAKNPLSFLWVTKPEIGLEPNKDPTPEEAYLRGKEKFTALIADGVFQRDQSPCFYVYQLCRGNHRQLGLVVGASADDYEQGKIKRHEHTRPEKEIDRARHTEILKINAGPVLTFFRSDPALVSDLERNSGTKAPVLDFVDPDGVRHVLWVVAEPQELVRLQDRCRKIDALYIADGHHRAASAVRVRNRLRAQNPQHGGHEAYNHFLAVIFPHDQLQILGYHRVVKDLNGLSSRQFLERVSEKFEVLPSSSPSVDTRHEFGMVLDSRWFRLRARAGSFLEESRLESLDVSILQANLLQPILGIDDPRRDPRIEFVGGNRGAQELERRCARDMRVAFLLHPVEVEQLMAVADASENMPPKSTWFEPKLRSGLVVRGIGDRD